MTDGDQPTRSSPLDSGGNTVLLVDDDKMLGLSTSRMIELLGHDVIMAHTGADAVSLFQRHRSEILLIMLDMIMPTMDGVETFRALQEIDPDVHVLIFSGYTEESKSKELMSLGVAGFIQKPFELDALSRAISQASEMGTR